jgi:redox-sensitive bicupin YhaK (pirin superfamily)
VSIQPCDAPGCVDRDGAIELLITSRAKDLGDFNVRRLLPAVERQRVGPFIFFDHMGPASFPRGRGIDVRPHPHIGLATITWLFDGVIQHRDNLGFDQAIRPGAVNWMTAGRGIVHSERTPQTVRADASTLHGLQLWVALPLEAEEMDPSFSHHPADTIPRVKAPGVDLALVAGTAYGEHSPVETASPMFYLAGEMLADASLALPTEHAERALYVVEGSVDLDGTLLQPGTMAVVRAGATPPIVAHEASRVALVGGAPLEGERHLWWNFVSSSRERLEQAKRDWKEGRFGSVPGDDEFIPLPD